MDQVALCQIQLGLAEANVLHLALIGGSCLLHHCLGRRPGILFLNSELTLVSAFLLLELGDCPLQSRFGSLHVDLKRFIVQQGEYFALLEPVSDVHVHRLDDAAYLETKI